MTLSELTEADASSLEKLSDKELFETLSPYFPETRPDQIVHKKEQQEERVYISPEKRAALELLKEEDGIDILGLMKKRKKK